MEPAPRKSHSEYIVAGTAVFVSLTTLCVYIYQAKIMNEQQHASVWPYLEWLSSNYTDFHLQVKNKGVGPAIVKKVEMTLDGKPVATNKMLVDTILGEDSKVEWINSTLEGRVLSPGEEVIPLRIPDLPTGREFERRLTARHFQMNVFYCSVYGDCWITSGVQVKPSRRLE